MAGTDPLPRRDRGPSLPALERLAPTPPLDWLNERVESLARPGDVVLDLEGHGGWAARVALGRQRRAVSIESSPLTRLLADIVVRPPDLRHLDAAFQALSTASRASSTVVGSIQEAFATRCAACNRLGMADELTWESSGKGQPVLVRRKYRCTFCREQRGAERSEAATEEDREIAAEARLQPIARNALRDRFPILGDDDDLADQLLALHSDRQLDALRAILERVEGDLRASSITAGLRLAFLHAALATTKIAGGGNAKISGPRISGGRMRPTSAAQWRERNPWLAFEDGYRLVRALVQRLEGGPHGAIQAKFGEDLRSMAESGTNVVLRLATESAYAALEAEGASAIGDDEPATFAAYIAGASQKAPVPRVRLVLATMPPPPSADRLALEYYATGWALGRAAASLLPIETLFHPVRKQTRTEELRDLARLLWTGKSVLARDGRIVVRVDENPADGVIAAALAGAAAGLRLASAHVEHGGTTPSHVELVSAASSMMGGPRTRANVPLPTVPGRAGDVRMVPGRGVFEGSHPAPDGAPTQRELAESAIEAAVQVLMARGEPAGDDQLVGEMLADLDHQGLLRRLAIAALEPDELDETPEAADTAEAAEAADAAAEPSEVAEAAAPARDARPTIDDPVASLREAIRRAMVEEGRRRITEIEPGRWWLALNADRDEAALPLSDRVEWAVFSLMATSGPLTESALHERLHRRFFGPDTPDEELVAACVDAYRSPTNQPGMLRSTETIAERSRDHSELIGLSADLGHRLGLQVAIAPREHDRLAGGRPLEERLDNRERSVRLSGYVNGPGDALEQVDCAWYSRSRAAFLVEVEWTAMISELVLRHHARIPTSERLVRLLVVVPERAPLLRWKLERSKLLRDAMEAQNWHVLKANHLRTIASLEAPTLADLQPYLGLDPDIERESGRQLNLFGLGIVETPAPASARGASAGGASGAGGQDPGDAPR